ncbi:DUF4174 domain-containing protein [Kordia algicida OT-1]|uniref:DUF4174 domain-containing protein n=1 Tax=Kordia algicida OT-1 TaxID=391587 RepID=A9ED86_9FLAO|nr:DUF4174 domain-containing protein [Kordia algicida]EDP94293.1 hypothetical protein KAOT1_06417 [Kordia algicida OT-1]
MRITLFIISIIYCLNINAQDLKKHRWEHRILIVKMPSVNSKEAQAQLKEINMSQEGMIERKLVLYTIIEDDFIFMNYENCQLNNKGKVSKKIKKILNSKDDFEILLIGLDGGIKLQQNTVLTKKALFNKIDAMPMRSNELRRKQQKN